MLAFGKYLVFYMTFFPCKPQTVVTLKCSRSCIIKYRLSFKGGMFLLLDEQRAGRLRMCPIKNLMGILLSQHLAHQHVMKQQVQRDLTKSNKGRQQLQYIRHHLQSLCCPSTLINTAANESFIVVYTISNIKLP